MGIDHGIKRIGVALSDASQLIAKELCVIVRKSRAEDFQQLKQLAEAHGVVGAVIGLPFQDAPQGKHTQADTVRLWAQRFQEAIGLPILFWDEQFTSEDAKNIARQQRRAPNQPIDDLAARLILQSYLDARRDGLASSTFIVGGE